jgi:hypothetical protein
MGFEFAPVQYQSQDISFTDWISLLTLCFAPLIAHIFAGAPQPSYLVATKPRWYDCLTLFNPTTIIYRYAAIVDRRIRAYRWEHIDAAATNAIFWTERGWDGTERMVTESIPCCTLLPETTRVKFFSTEFLKTIITTVQGVAAAISLIGGLASTENFNPYFAVDSIFAPLAVFGLLRLFASFWLLDDFSYSAKPLVNDNPLPEIIELERRQGSLDSLILQLDGEQPRYSRYRTTSYWPSRLFRVFYAAMLLGIWTLAGSWLFFVNAATPYRVYYTATALLAGAFYFLLFTITTVVCVIYLFQKNSTSCILPCVSHLWFKVYTILCILCMLAAIIVSALETRRTMCGYYTSLPVALTGYYYCALEYIKGDTIGLLVDPNPRFSGWFQTFGIVSQYDWGQNVTGLGLGAGEFWVGNFSGVCLGSLTDNQLWTRSTPLGYANSTNVGEMSRLFPH